MGGTGRYEVADGGYRLVVDGNRAGCHTIIKWQQNIDVFPGSSTRSAPPEVGELEVPIAPFTSAVTQILSSRNSQIMSIPAVRAPGD